MGRLLLERLVSLVPVLIGIAVVAFFAIRLVPGDAALARLGQDATPELLAEVRRSMNIDRPVHVQFIDWFAHIATLDFGSSLTSRRPILPDILLRLPATLELATAATLLSIFLAIPLGVLSAVRRGGIADFSGRIFTLVGLSIPSFWLALQLMQLVSLRFHLLPAVGYVAWIDDPVENVRRLILPAVSLGVGMAAVVARYTRSSLLDVLGQDYIRTARGKGLLERKVVYRHALKNALVPVVTIAGIQAGTLIGGTIIVEEIFAWPGLGRFMLQAIYERDYPVVQTTVMIMAFFFVLINLVVDVLYVYLDPRIRYR